MKKFMNFALAVSISFIFFGGLNFVSAQALSSHNSLSIVASDSQVDACNGLNQLGGNTQCNDPTTTGQARVGNFAGAIVSIISYIAGAIAIIMIIISGIRYTTSGGDQTKVSSAKSALIYALIGLGVAGLAQILVHFVISTAAGV